MYYNEDLKERYIKEKEETTVLPENYLQRLFELTSKCENKFGKDVCNFTVLEIEEFYKIINSTSVGRLMFTNSSLRQYTQWCLNQSLVIDSQNHFEEFDFEKLQTLINVAAFSKSIISKRAIIEWLDILCNPCDKFIIEAIYEGINGKMLSELTNLKLSDFDLDNHTVTLRDETGIRTIPVSERLCNLAIDSAKEEYYYPNNGEGDSKVNAIKYLDDPDLILKNHPRSESAVSSFQLGRRLKNKILRIAKYVDAPYLTVMALTNSGKINFVKERCEEYCITGEEFLLSDHINELNEQFNCKTNRTIFLRKYGSYLP